MNRRKANAPAIITKPRASIDVPPVIGCCVPPAPPAPLPPRPPGATVVVVAPPAGFVVVVAPPDDDDDDADDPVDCGAIDVPGAEVGLVLAVLEGLVVLDAARSVESLPARSPGLAMASTTPAPRTTMAAIKRSDARCFSVETSSWERVTGVEPASPAWKAGALPLSYTRVHGWKVVART
ncbi:MAG: hypothetical protein QOI95_815 [Acidimicrobiaceae bacterium]